MPPSKDIDFSIDLVPNAAPVSRSPYIVIPFELLEMKIQLQELQEKGYIRPSVSLWGAPMLFVKNKDDTFIMCIDY